MTRTQNLESQKKKENRIVDNLLTTVNENEIKGFRGNPLLKRSGEVVEMTPEHIREYKKCMKDPIYFSEKYIKIVNIDKGLIPIKLYDYQKKLINSFKENRFNIVLACRQSGKCVNLMTQITIRNPEIYSGEPFSIRIGDFYEWMRFRRDVQKLLDA